MAMKYVTTFKVTGRGEFPFDMLRYDRCFPADPTSVSYIWVPSSTTDRVVVLRQYHTLKTPQITPERWRSFWWSVVEAETVTEKL